MVRVVEPTPAAMDIRTAEARGDTPVAAAVVGIRVAAVAVEAIPAAVVVPRAVEGVEGEAIQAAVVADRQAVVEAVEAAQRVEDITED